MPDPIDSVEWRASRDLRGNDYNPNYVLLPELNLLERSILKTGWTAPVTILQDGTIVDGFHRWRLSLDSRRLRERYSERVPTVTIDATPEQAKAATVRLNRARGTHVAMRMSQLVRQLLEDGLDSQEIAAELGMEPNEVETLSQDSIYKARNLDQYRYSRSWIPIEKTK
jgi:ParB-like chromosome segregation protein Spo0J